MFCKHVFLDLLFLLILNTWCCVSCSTFLLLSNLVDAFAAFCCLLRMLWASNLLRSCLKLFVSSLRPPALLLDAGLNDEASFGVRSEDSSDHCGEPQSHASRTSSCPYQETNRQVLSCRRERHQTKGFQKSLVSAETPHDCNRDGSRL